MWHVLIGYICSIMTKESNQRTDWMETGTELPIMEDFYSIQGEGAHTGVASYFIRIGGCDVGCHWCDVKESWNAEIHPLIGIKEVVDRAISQVARTVILTGGEPLKYELGPLTDVLKMNGFSVHLETSGAYGLSGSFQWVCLSPKKTAPPLPEMYKVANELKVIIHNRKDLEWAISQAEQVGPDCLLYLQPEWGRRNEVMPMIIDHVKEDPNWRISLQSHKYMRIP